MTQPFDLDHFRARLEARRDELKGLQEMSAQSRGAVVLDQTSIGRVSRIDAIQQQEMALAAERQRAGELTRIKAALERIADGSYGYCLTCEEPIALKRLEFDPSVPTCIDCASGRQR
jgi:RNA polymerase-binding transcription factor